MCDQLQQINDFSIRHNPRLRPLDVIRIACGHCDRKEVCPELGVDAYVSLSRSGYPTVADSCLPEPATDR